MLHNLAIVVAHPGHELVVHHLMELSRPRYYCLTDGSGGNGQPRIDSTDALLQRIGATRGAVYGRFSDRELYRLLLHGDANVFAELSRSLADAFIDADVRCVAGDAMEGFNPAHDICRALIDSAVAIVEAKNGRVIENYEFAVYDAASNDSSIRLQLDDAALDRKIAAAMAYREMHEEVEAALNRVGRDAYAVESLRPASTRAMLERFETIAPAYEATGEQRVAAGRYRDVIRYREHVLPVFHAPGIGVAQHLGK
jgi:hypothetical protein